MDIVAQNVFRGLEPVPGPLHLTRSRLSETKLDTLLTVFLNLLVSIILLIHLQNPSSTSFTSQGFDSGVLNVEKGGGL